MHPVALVSLHKHWITADAVKERMFFNRPHESDDMPAGMVAVAKAFSAGQTLVVFYALLYVVVEGYHELQLSDKAVDALLAQGGYEAGLRRFRNAVFHYQEDPFDKRLIEFLNLPKSEDWTKALHNALSAFFVKTLKLDEVLVSLKTSSDNED